MATKFIKIEERNRIGNILEYSVPLFSLAGLISPQLVGGFPLDNKICIIIENIMQGWVASLSAAAVISLTLYFNFLHLILELFDDF